MKKLFCENCGSKIEDGTLFCSVCGSRIENDDEDIIESFAEVSSYADISAPEEETSISENRINLPVNEPIVNTAYKKASYKFEKVLLAVSAICAVCSLAFYLIVANFNGIPMVNKSGNHPTDVPVLTVDMAEEILNNATDFPYQYFEERNMINKNDYIIHPDFIEYASDGDYRCYAVDGIETKDDFFSYFEKYGTREFIEKSLDQSYFYVEKNSKIYFSDNFGMGWYPYSAASMFVEKIDDETYYVKSEEGIVEGVIFKYIDGTFKATTISAKEAYAPYNERGASIDLPDIQLGFESTLDSVEKELKKVGLKLDRDNIVYVKAYWGTDGAESYVTAFQKSYKKYKPGEYVGVIVAVEEPDFYARGAKDGETVPSLTKEKAVEILDIAAFLPMSLHFYETGILNQNDYIEGEYGNYCSASGIDTVDDLKNYYTQFVTETLFYKMSDWYKVVDGKPYFLEYDVGDGGFSEDFMIIEKIDDYTYYVYDTRLMREIVIIYSDGCFKVSDVTEVTLKNIYSNSSETVEIPYIADKTISEAEYELSRVGLKLDRSNITFVASNYRESTVVAAKNSWKRVKPGSAIGIYVAVENPEDYNGNGNNESVEQTNELTDDEARQLLIEASSVFNKWLSPLGYRFIESPSDFVDGDFHCVNENDYIFTTDENGYEYKLYAVVDDEIKSVSDLITECGKYFDKEFVNNRCSEYIDRNGKMYVAVNDGFGDWEPCSDYTDDIEKISENHYLYYIGNYSEELGENVAVYYDLIIEDGNWVFTEKYDNDHPVSPCGGFMPVYNAVERIKD